MSSIMRTFTRAPRARLVPSISAQPRRFAHQSYGNEQSGHEQGLHEKNPKQNLEHPGPKTPAEEGQSGGQSPSKSADSSNGGKPTIHDPKSAAEETDPDVKKHNDEMRQRADRSANQLGEEDNKVDKKFWSGDVGDIKKDK